MMVRTSVAVISPINYQINIYLQAVCLQRSEETDIKRLDRISSDIGSSFETKSIAKKVYTCIFTACLKLYSV